MVALPHRSPMSILLEAAYTAKSQLRAETLGRGLRQRRGVGALGGSILPRSHERKTSDINILRERLHMCSAYARSLRSGGVRHRWNEY